MDFFDRQARAQKQTRRLACLFGLAVVAAVVVNNLLLGAVCYIFSSHPLGSVTAAFYLFGEALMYPGHFLRLILHWQSAAIISCSTVLSIAVGASSKMRQLSAGGPVMAELLGGRRIKSNASDAGEQRLRNVIEEMAVASGTSVPEIYVLDNERGINAFAAGHTRDDVAIGVTRGCLLLLTRDELQGVIAHEFSHILNGDTRLNMRLIGLAHGLFWPTLVGRVLIYGTTEAPAIGESCLDEQDRVKILPTAPLGLLFVILGSSSLLFVRFIKSAICRQREWLADASAVQFTRYPAGITGALQKIGGLFKQGRLDTPHAEVASHLYFADSGYEPWFGFLATHPPLVKRIVAIDPVFDGNFPKVKMLAPNQYERDQAFDTALGKTLYAVRRFPESTLALDGAASSEHLRQVSLMRLGLPPQVKSALQEPVGAVGVIFSLLLSSDDSIRGPQVDILQNNLVPEVFATIRSLAPQVEALGDRYKLTLAELAVPALRQTTPDVQAVFRQTVQQLIDCEGSIGLFEYALMKMVARQLSSHFSGPDLVAPRYGRTQDLLPECALLLSALAHVGQENEADAREAFASGAKYLDSPAARPQFLTRSQWDLSKIDAALTKLAAYHDPLKRNVLLACGRTVITDGHINEREAELLRAIADTLACPVPPFVEVIRGEELAKAE